MSGITRYESFVAAAYGGPYAALRPSDYGSWVCFDAHTAEIARLRAEADALRVEVDRMRKVVRKIRARAESEGTCVAHGPQYVAGLRNAANMIEKAMGADA